MDAPSTPKNEAIGPILFAVAALATVVGLGLHPAETDDIPAQMEIVRDHEAAWRTSHWVGSVSLPLLAVGAIFLLSRRSTPADSALGALSLSGVAVFFGLATLITLLEATVMPMAALAGDAPAFASWRALEKGLVLPFALGILSLSGVAFSRVRAPSALAAKVFAGLAGAAGVLSAGGLIGAIAGVHALHPLKMAGLVTFLYIVYLGFATARSPKPSATARNARDRVTS